MSTPSWDDIRCPQPERKPEVKCTSKDAEIVERQENRSREMMQELADKADEIERLTQERDESARAWRDSFNSMHTRTMRAEALIRELVAALEQIAKATYDDHPASRFQMIRWAEAALAKAKAAGYSNKGKDNG